MASVDYTKVWRRRLVPITVLRVRSYRLIRGGSSHACWSLNDMIVVSAPIKSHGASV